MNLILFSQQGTVNIPMDKEGAFGLNIQAKDFSVVNEKTNVTFYSQGGGIDYVMNKEALQTIVDRNCYKPSDFVNRSSKAWLVADAGTFLGTIVFKGVSNSAGRIKIDFTFYGGAANWVDNLPEYLFDLDLGESLFRTGEIISAESYIGPYDGEVPFWYSYKVYNRFTNDAQMNLIDIRPDLHFKAIIDALESESGLNWTSQIFTSDWFGHWLMPFVGTRLLHRVAIIDTPPAIPMTGFLNTGLWVETFDSGGYHDEAHDRFLTEYVADAEENQVFVEFFFDWDVSSLDDSATVYVFNKNLFNYIGEGFQLEIGQNQFKISGYVSNGDQILILVDGSCNLNSGEIIYHTDVTEPIDFGYILNKAPIQRNIKTIDFISAMTEMLNLVWYHDGSNNRLIVETKFGAELPSGEIIDGFYKASTFANNWSEFTDCENHGLKDITASFKEFHYKFKEDEDDVYISDPDQFGQIVPLKDVGNSKEKKNKIFAPTLNQNLHDDYVNSDYVPIPHMGIELNANLNADAVPYHNFLPRILFKMGVIKSSMFVEGSLPFNTLLAAQQYALDPLLDQDMESYALTANLTYQDFNGVKGFISLFYGIDELIWKYGGRRKVKMNVPMNRFWNIENALRYKQLVNLPNVGQGTHIIESFRIILNKKSTVEFNLIDLAIEQININR